MTPFADARFLASAHDPAELPPDAGPEIAFAGRSNAGKSSAINALVKRRRLAFVSKTPGRTQTINFFECAGGRRLVDLPGYGYAAVSQTERNHWAGLISTYLQGRASLRGLVLIADSRRGLTPRDEQLIAWYASSGGPLLVLLTKADKLARSNAGVVLKKTQEQLMHSYPAGDAVLFSAIKGTGVESAQRALNGWLTTRSS